MWILAGPNGSGKTTIAGHHRVVALTAGGPSLNADDVAATIAHQAGTDVTPSISLTAATIIDSAVNGNVKNRVGFTVETVLSSPKYKAMVKAARAAGFQIGLIFVFTSRADLNVLRVSQRVSAGGHSVPKDKVRSRWIKSIENLAWFANRADQLLLIDNSRSPVFLMERLPNAECRQLAPITTPAVIDALSHAEGALKRRVKSRAAKP